MTSKISITISKYWNYTNNNEHPGNAISDMTEMKLILVLELAEKYK